MNDTTELSIIDEITPAQYPEIYGQGNLGQFFERVKKEVAGEVPDLETAKGRSRIASLAAKVSKSKVAVEKPGREYLRQIKQLPKTIETELREFVQQMDALRDETRRPLTEWETVEAQRIESHKYRIMEIESTAVCENGEGDRLDSATLKGQMKRLESCKMGDHWEEFEAEAARAKELAAERLTAAIERQEKYESEQAELDRLRKEQAEKEQRERDDRIRQEAIEAERKAAQEKAEAEANAKREAEERAERERQHELETARREKAEAEARELRAKQETEDRARQAVIDERNRIEAERKRAEQDAEKKAANQRHRAKINREALADLQKHGMTEADAKTLIESIVRGNIRHISINY